MLRCRSCGGIYEPELPDKTRYFHACPPLSAHEILDEHAAGTSVLSPPTLAALDAALAADRATPPKAGEPSRVDQVLASLTIERPNKRDETVTHAAEPGLPARIKSDGAGVDVRPAREP